MGLVNPEAEGRQLGGGGAKPPHESGRPKADSKGGCGGAKPPHGKGGGCGGPPGPPRKAGGSGGAQAPPA